MYARAATGRIRMGSSSTLSRLQQQLQYLSNGSTMPTATNGMSKPHPLKVLMLHGYTQNGPLFHAKTKVMEKHLAKVFPGIELHYPTGPIRLRPSDVPGFDASKFQSDDDGIEAYAWWRKSDFANPVEYTGLEDGLKSVANVLESQGPFDGVMGFSQGAALAAMVASLLDGDTRRQAFKAAQGKSKHAISYPASFDRLDHPPLKFCVVYCGFLAPGERYKGFYEDPHIQTPMCHVIGSVDSVVEEARTQLLVTAAGGEDKTHVIMHPGSHFVPTGKQYIEMVAAFIRSTTTPKSTTQAKDEEDVENMDVPF